MYNAPRVIYVDVDGTLRKGDGVDPAVAAWCKEKHAAGFELVLWSSAGEAHALKWAEAAGIRPMFSHVLSKPGVILDDKCWQWTIYTRALASIDDDYPASPE